MKFTISDTIPRAALVTGGSAASAPSSKRSSSAGFAVALQCHPDAEDDPPAGAMLLPADLADEAQTDGAAGPGCRGDRVRSAC